jgi:RNA polymerase sigma-70 factor (ECF subfamily)
VTATVTASEAKVEQHIGDLRRYAKALLGDWREADDLVQECLVRALARPQFHRQVRDVRAYLFTILHNVYVDKVTRRPREKIGLDPVVTYLAHPAPQPSSLELRDLARALTRLPEDQRQVVLLIGLEGLTYQQAAEVLDVPIGTVMSRLSRGREALRRMMDGEQHEPLRRVQ